MKYTHISNGSAVIQRKVIGQRAHTASQKSSSWFSRRSFIFKFGLLAANIVLLGAIGTTVVYSKTSSTVTRPSAVTLGSDTPNPLDPVSSSDIAASVARLTRLPETTAIVNQAQSADVQAASPTSDGGAVVQKPNVIGTALKSKADIVSYVSQAGDTVSSLAAKFGVTSDSIRWSNNLTGNTVGVSKQLYLPPISSGIVYTVKAGDTPDTLAQTYHANRGEIVAFNDAELKGLTVGERVVIPNGSVIPPAAASSFQSLGTGFAWGGDSPVYGGNGYDFGQCTYWAALRRSQLGMPIPSNLGNAVTWVQLARKAGLETGNTPKKGAVIWTPPTMLSSYYAAYGHVGIVEDVLPDGTVKVSDMNVKGWNVLSARTLSPEHAVAYSYIY